MPKNRKQVRSTYNKSLDLLLAALLAKRDGNFKLCATYIAQAAEDDSADEAVDMIEAINGEDGDEEFDFGDDDLEAAIASTAKGKKTAKAAADEDGEKKNTEEEDAGADDATDDLFASADDSEVEESRMARASFNRRVLARVAKAKAGK